MENKKEKNSIVGWILIILMSLITILSFGWVTSLTWNWFIVDVFNASKLDVPKAIGLAMFLRLLTYKYKDRGDFIIRKELENAFTYNIALLILLLINYITYLFISL